jgi:hypothetical protein
MQKLITQLHLHIQNYLTKIQSKPKYKTILILSLVFIAIFFSSLIYTTNYLYKYKIIIGIVSSGFSFFINFFSYDYIYKNNSSFLKSYIKSVIINFFSGIILLSFFLFFIPIPMEFITIYCESDSDSDSDSDSESDNEPNKENKSPNSKTTNSMNKSSDNTRISEIESSKDNNNNANKDVYSGSLTLDKSFTDMAVKEMGKVLVDGIGKLATEMGPYTTASGAASAMAKATTGMPPGPRIATVSLTSAGTYIATKSASVATENFIANTINTNSTDNSSVDSSTTSSPIDSSFINSPLELTEITSPLENILYSQITLNIGILLLIFGLMVAILSKTVLNKNNSLFTTWIGSKLSKNISDRLTKIVSYFGQLNDKFLRIMIIIIFLIIILFMVFNIYISLNLYIHIDDFISVHNFIHNDNNKSITLFFLSVSNLKTHKLNYKKLDLSTLLRVSTVPSFIFLCKKYKYNYTNRGKYNISNRIILKSPSITPVPDKNSNLHNLIKQEPVLNDSKEKLITNNNKFIKLGTILDFKL